VLRELVRVDIEFAWRQGRPRLTEDYLAQLPALREDPAGIAAVAYEEYRQRQLAGQGPSPAEYRARLGVETTDWPLDPGTSANRAPVGPGPQHGTEPNGTDHETAGSVAQAVSALPPGGEILGFRLVRELGRGAFGRVYLARQGDLADRLVVLKVSGATPALEPRVLARLQHTNIVPVHSVHQTGPLQVLCMPYFGATTLEVVVRELRQLPVPPSSGHWLFELLERRAEGDSAKRAVQLFSGSYVTAVLGLAARLADGLAYAHERGVLHQDLKPANVLLGDDGQPMLLDFNLAHDSAIRASAGPDHVGGTLAYMAPEHLEAFRDGRTQADPRSDIYALGLILDELLTGQPTFSVAGGHTDVQEMIAARQAGPPDVRRRNKEATAAVASILKRCLAPVPSQRYQSARQLGEDIERHLADRPLRWAPEPSWRERARKWARRHPRLSSGYLVAALAAVLLVGVGAAYVGRTYQLARAEAVNTRHESSENLQHVRFLLGGPAPDAPDLAAGIEVAERILGRYRVLEDPNWTSAPAVAALTEEERTQLRGDLRELLLFLGRGVRLQVLTTAPGEWEERLRYAVRLNELAESCGPAEQGMRPILLQRSLLLNLSGRPDEARELMHQAAALPASTARDLYLAGVEKMAGGDYRGAASVLQQARRANPQDAFVCYALGLCHAELGEFPKAAAALEASIALWPNFHGSHYQRGRVHNERKEHQEAVAEFGEALRLRPDFNNARIDRALARLALKDFQGADSDLTAALASGTAPTRVYFIRAHVRRLAGDEKGAAADRALGLKCEPTDDQSWVARGLARLANHQPNEALSDFDQALALNPRCLAALEDRAAVLADLPGRTAEAVQALDRAIELYPEHAQARAGRGVLLARLGKYEEALRDAREAERLDAEPANLYRVAGIYALASREKGVYRREAFRLLAAALRAGYGFEYLNGDPELASLRALPEFKRLVAAALLLRQGGEQR
jgi:serine/threonine protein kinase/tetratricopeptide (TPR) repeat protein